VSLTSHLFLLAEPFFFIPFDTTYLHLISPREEYPQASKWLPTAVLVSLSNLGIKTLPKKKKELPKV
jgi:hypothetical protein